MFFYKIYCQLLKKNLIKKPHQVLGASGDLAKKKTYPALFALHCSELMPEAAHIIGYARSKMTKVFIYYSTVVKQKTF